MYEDETGITGIEGMLKLVTLEVSRYEDESQVFRLRSIIMAEIEPTKGE